MIYNEICQGNLIILQKYYKRIEIYDKLIQGDENESRGDKR